eukprot:scaffold126810_cov17-Tisochrysis_lutea.AAC.1
MASGQMQVGHYTALHIGEHRMLCMRAHLGGWVLEAHLAWLYGHDFLSLYVPHCPLPSSSGVLFIE